MEGYGILDELNDRLLSINVTQRPTGENVHLALKLGLSQSVRTKPRKMGNPHQCADAVECAEHIPATSSKVFVHTGDTDKFEQKEFQNCPRGCGTEVRSKLAS